MITKSEAMQVNSTIYVIGLYNSDGTAVRYKINGKCKTWKTRPSEFKVPIKYGLKGYDYLTDENAHLFSLTEPAPINKKDVDEANRKFRF